MNRDHPLKEDGVTAQFPNHSLDMVLHAADDTLIRCVDD